MENIIIEPAITDHCNLNCAYCDHFSPLAPKGFYNIDQFEKDIIELSKILFDSEISKKYTFGIQLLGGEPLLNKDLYKYIRIVRKYIDVNKLSIFNIITNGISLLGNIPEELIQEFNNCNNLNLTITEYTNSKIDYNKIKEKYRQFARQLNRFKNTSDFVLDKLLRTDKRDFFTKTNLDFYDDSFKAETGYFYCLLKNHCMTLREGILYPCAIVGNYKFLKETFNTPNIDLDRYELKEKSKQKFLEFLEGPWDFCKYCKPRTMNVEWKISEKSITEWT